jgi:hypothetical protein
METKSISDDLTRLVTTKGRYIASGQIGTKTAQLYLMNDQHYVVWYKRSINFMSLHKIEAVSEETARMLFR